MFQHVIRTGLGGISTNTRIKSSRPDEDESFDTVWDLCASQVSLFASQVTPFAHPEATGSRPSAEQNERRFNTVGNEKSANSSPPFFVTVSTTYGRIGFLDRYDRKQKKPCVLFGHTTNTPTVRMECEQRDRS